ncbi:DTW domain-containing protein [Sansalvadorimonas sp. 2012CJ34-2]|uniref:tRNA-uridine aminocarboxypropyltransferase n=1 Tax=Parendozoicomonas callyspongiae TaxID=2942213 RepID=A0ABT0PHQ4_9GAMM|nr:tRNA-uridine aminocarboxypropyltransferase [Sansalvadorimonas sp. 2012CJ34-2]MCL6270917.1 DTW domain-containing protein [Sansalvadorimonas sp. 2012CJ34-2]
MAREVCGRCERPISVCICNGLRSYSAPVQIVILQTARERKHAVNTGRIVNLGISNSLILTDEDFSEQAELAALLDKWKGKTWLLYPGDDAVTPKEMVRHSGNYGEGLLVVLDATWRKSKRMLYLSPRLTELPRVALPESSLSSYRIRKAPGPGYLSTVEAVAACLGQAGHPAEGCRQMIQSFERMIEFQVKAMGEETYQRNYTS